MSSNNKMNAGKINKLQDVNRKMNSGSGNSSDGGEQYSLLLPCDTQRILTECELAVLYLLATGLQQKEIAYKYSISSQTVKCHAINIYRKLNVANLIEAIIRYNTIIRNLNDTMS